MKASHVTCIAASVLMILSACGDNGSNNGANNGGGNNGGQNLSAQMVDCSEATIAQEVDVVDNAFEPADTTIAPNGVVRWTVTGSNTHTVTSGEASASDAGAMFDSGNVTTDDTFCVQFENTGTYDYHCIPHAAAGMTGTVTVQGE